MKHANAGSPRIHVVNDADTAAWVVKQPGLGEDGSLTVTFVVLPDGLWVADRHSEHVACAQGAPVHSAGEMTFALDRRRSSVEVVYVTNQSTGYCPEPESWPAVEAALDAAGIAHPGRFSAEMVFRRCPKCASTNIVKDECFACAVCGADLPREWNYGGFKSGFSISSFRVLPESQLSEQHFDEFPVWSELYDYEEIDEIVGWGLEREQVLQAIQDNHTGNEHCVYTMLEANPFPPRMRIFIAASLEAANCQRLKGFVMNEDADCLTVFSNGHEFHFSRHPSPYGLDKESEQRLLQSLGWQDGELFPMKYVTRYHNESGGLIAGTFHYGGQP